MNESELSKNLLKNVNELRYFCSLEGYGKCITELRLFPLRGAVEALACSGFRNRNVSNSRSGGSTQSITAIANWPHYSELYVKGNCNMECMPSIILEMVESGETSASIGTTGA